MGRYFVAIWDDRHGAVRNEKFRANETQCYTAEQTLGAPRGCENLDYVLHLRGAILASGPLLLVNVTPIQVQNKSGCLTRCVWCQSIISSLILVNHYPITLPHLTTTLRHFR